MTKEDGDSMNFFDHLKELRRKLLFSIVFLTIVTSEISLRYSTQNTYGLFFFIFFPIFIFLTIYISLIFKLRNKT